MTKRPILFSKETKKTFDKGTPDEQTVRYAPVPTHAQILIDKAGWALSEFFNVEEECFHWGKKAADCSREHKRLPRPGNRYIGTGLYMSQRAAQRLRFVWRGRSMYSLFWGSRTHNGRNFRWVNDRKGFQW